MKKTLFVIASVTIMVTLAYLSVTARYYTSAGNVYGVAWDAGGIEYSDGTIQPFMCTTSGHMQGNKWVRDWTNPLAPYFPELMSDC